MGKSWVFLATASVIDGLNQPVKAIGKTIGSSDQQSGSIAKDRC
jgi:hypothetical protein